MFDSNDDDRRFTKQSLTADSIDQQIAAICDVDQRKRDNTSKLKGLNQARTYHDYRDLLDKETGVDAVVVATPNHWPVPICQAALESGKHVYCEKPLAHSVAECRVLVQLAKSHPQLATQTGNQGCSTEGFRRSYEVIQSGLLGNITEVHVWHPAHGWPNGVDRPANSDPVERLRAELAGNHSVPGKPGELLN